MPPFTFGTPPPAAAGAARPRRSKRDILAILDDALEIIEEAGTNDILDDAPFQGDTDNAARH